MTGDAPSHRTVSVDDLGRLPEFSHATIAGDTIYVSGTLGTTKGLTLASGGVGPETEQALRNVERILHACGATLGHVVKVDVSLVDMDDFAAMNAAYRPFFATDPPARITVGVAELALGASVELDCVAWNPSAGST